MPDLHSRISSELSRRLEVAKAATPGPWRGGDWSATFGTAEQQITTIEHAPDFGPFPQLRMRDLDCAEVLAIEDPDSENEQQQANLTFIVLHDPADSIRRYSSALRVLERHRRYIVPEGYGALSGKPNCAVCNGHVYPCEEVVDLCASLGLDTEGSTTDG